MIFGTPPIVTNGLISYLDASNYKSYVSGSANWFDLTPNTNSGSLVSTPTYSTDGPSILLNGSTQHIECKDIAAISGSTQLSVFYWVKPTSLGVSQCMVAQWDYQTQACFAFQISNANTTSVTLFICPTLNDGGTNYNIYNSDFANQKWSYVGFVYDGSQSTNQTKAKVYIDGALATFSSTGGTIPTSLLNASSTVKIGKFGGSLARYFPGNFGSFKMYTRALTAGEVLQNYNATKSRYNRS
jgi:hypothetical protein